MVKLLCRRRGITFAPEREGERGKTGGRGRKSQGSSGRLGCWVSPTCAPHPSPPFSTLLWTPSLTPLNSPDLRGPSASGFQLGLAHGRCCQESRGQGRGWGGYSLAPFQPLPEVTGPAKRSPPSPAQTTATRAVLFLSSSARPVCWGDFTTVRDRMLLSASSLGLPQRGVLGAERCVPQIHMLKSYPSRWWS